MAKTKTSFVIDEIGNKYGRWTVLKRSSNNKDGAAHWLCQCNCGNPATVRGYNLRSGRTQSCGCFQREKAQQVNVKLIEPLTRFGRLIVLKRSSTSKSRKAQWLCRCDCGNLTIVQGVRLRNGHTQSCGCFWKERARRAPAKPVKLLTCFGKLTVLSNGVNREGNSHICYICYCNCGTITVVTGSELRRGHTKSCGCSKIERLTTHGKSKTLEYRRWRHRQRKELDKDWTLKMDDLLHTLFPACVVCGSGKKLSIDHVNPISKGFGLEPGNAIVLCNQCNASKHNRNLDELDAEVSKKIVAAAAAFEHIWKYNKCKEMRIQ